MNILNRPYKIQRVMAPSSFAYYMISKWQNGKKNQIFHIYFLDL